MESSIRGISIFGKLSWGMLGHGKTIIHSSNGNICLCLFLVVSHPLFYVAGYVMPLCRHSIAFTICLRDRKTAKSYFEQVVPGDVHCCVVMVCLCCCLRCILSKFQVLYGHLISVFCLNSCWWQRTMLEKGKNKVLPCGRNSVGALDSALSSIPFGSMLFVFRGSLKLCSRQH